ncbi:MAG TPA: ADP-ribosylglycohydrolase family protein [Rectinemataceae bacterium]
MGIPKDYLERVYAGFLGKNVGIRLGAPVEPAIWTYDRIREVYGDVRGYLKPYRMFAADDDANGPVYFIRPLLDALEGEKGGLDGIASGRAPMPAPDPASVGRAWLDYSREGAGMFWWGGYGRSTEHTAYLNLKNGIPAPESGSMERNGRIAAEQIGGQIFIDTWGLVWPGRPDKAAEYAEAAASVSHDGEGLNGARFIAACIAAAFELGDMRSVVDAGLSCIPSGSKYAEVARSVISFHDAHPEDWRPCQEYLIAEWGYDRWPGLCHIIPNAGVCVLSLLYGEGSFSRTVEIATMCGWDTDCNAGNVGTIAGVLYGLDSIPAHYRNPINDALVLSGLPGSLNILDIPSFSRRLAAAGYRLAGENPPEALTRALEKGGGERAWYFDFALPGSTHGLRVSDPVAFSATHRSGMGLEFRFERLTREMSGKLFFKPFYRRADFDDERYSPVFSPAARPGQKARISFKLERWEGQSIGVEGYVRDFWSGKDIAATSTVFPADGENVVLEFVIPELGGSAVDEVGLRLTSFSGKGKRDSGRLFIDSFWIGGRASYTIDPARQALEFGCVTPFSHEGGSWSLESGRLQLMTPSEGASYTGGYRVADQKISCRITPLAGESHFLIVRAGGAMRSYLGGLDAGGVSIYKKDFGLTRLAYAPLAWEKGRDYELSFEARGERLSLMVDGVPALEVRDGTHASGMVGCGSLEAARALYGPFAVEEL